MAIVDQVITENYALYHGDCVEVMASYPENSIDLSVYSPPFGGLYTYSSDPRDLSNCLTKEEFFEQYDYVIREIHRITKPGRMTAVHCMDIPSGNTGLDHCYDFSGDIIRHHEAAGFEFAYRHFIHKDALKVRNRTMAKGLAHKTIVEDSTRASIAHADQLVVFRKKGENTVPVAHPHGFLEYAGEQKIPYDLLQYRDFDGDQKQNRYSHWIWQRYAAALWTDIRVDRVLPYQDARDAEDEKHCHPLQLDVIERCVVLYSNPGEVVWTPCMGVGSEVYGAVINGRKGIGAELKASYYHQAVKNVAMAEHHAIAEAMPLFAPHEAMVAADMWDEDSD